MYPVDNGFYSIPLKVYPRFSKPQGSIKWLLGDDRLSQNGKMIPGKVGEQIGSFLSPMKKIK